MRTLEHSSYHYLSPEDESDAAKEHEPTEADIAAAVVACEHFLNENSPSLGALFGLRYFSIRIGEKWTTNLNTSEVTADPRFFLEKGYTPEMSAYAITHEIAAHLREVEFAPALTRQVIGFLRDTDPQLRKAKGIFHNVFSDIAGNRLIHATLPAMEQVAEDLYAQKLFSNTDYTSIPRHLQFLYKAMRQEMIPGSETAVFPEVDAMIDEFRNFKGQGDLIDYSTKVAKSRTVAMSNEEKFAIWTRIIYPRWLELYEADTQDPDFNKQGESSESTSSEEVSKEQPDFSEYYEQYEKEIHPDPIDHDDMDKLKEEVSRQKAKENRDKRQRAREEAERADPVKQLDEQIRRETGFSLAEKRRYDNKIIKWRNEITELRSVFRTIINERIAHTRRLRGNHTDGALLNPETLAQTYIDAQTNHPAPPAYADYEKRAAERRLTGKTDYVFVFDRSGSMVGQNSEAAAASLVMCLEALAGMERDIRAAEEEANVEVDLDIRTAVYMFESDISQPKKLSPGLSDKERLESYSLVTQPTGGTADYLAFQDIETYPDEPERKRIIIAVSDGESNDRVLAQGSIRRLRNRGWYVYGVSINSDAAVTLYAPDSQRVDNPAELPSALRALIERTLL